uniref:Histone deacetylase n=1 Tax=candidate division WOR-3 bacterium TaxID=2052148 RepID=A0A7C3Z286_UNCW3
MKFVYSERYRVNFGPHVFPTEKYKLIKERLLAEGLAKEDDFLEPPEVSLDDIRLVHTEEYIQDMLNLRWTSRTIRSELPLTWEIIQFYFLAASGTILTCRLALEEKIGFHIGGGFHHAFPNHGEGFCYVNDIAIAIKKLQKEERIKKAAVIDCDLHQGNGTARIFQDDPSVFTFSIHQENLYPIKERSDWDIGLLDFTGDDVYLNHLREAVPQIYDSHQPELVIYNAGADPYYDDQLGLLQLTKEGLKMRDEIVIDEAYKREIPVAIVLAGGYARKVEDTVEIHTNTAKVCLAVLNQLPEARREEEMSREERRDEN